METLLTATQIHIMYTHLLYERLVSSLHCILMNYKVVHSCIFGDHEWTALSTSAHTWHDLTLPLHLQINNYITWGKQTQCVYTKKRNEIFCVESFSISHKIEGFYKGVWVISPGVTKQQPILVIVKTLLSIKCCLLSV